MQLSELREKEIHEHAALYLAPPKCCECQGQSGCNWMVFEERQQVASYLYLECPHPWGGVCRIGECEKHRLITKTQP